MSTQNIEFWLEPGGDFEQLPNGDIRLAYDNTQTSDATRQRILRTLLTNARIIVNGLGLSYPDYIAYPDFGASLPALVGKDPDEVITLATAKIEQYIAPLESIQPGTLQISIEQQNINTVVVTIQCETKTGSSVKTTFPLGAPIALTS